MCQAGTVKLNDMTYFHILRAAEWIHPLRVPLLNEAAVANDHISAPNLWRFIELVNTQHLPALYYPSASLSSGWFLPLISPLVSQAILLSPSLAIKLLLRHERSAFDWRAWAHPTRILCPPNVSQPCNYVVFCLGFPPPDTTKCLGTSQHEKRMIECFGFWAAFVRDYLINVKSSGQRHP